VFDERDSDLRRLSVNK